MQTVRLSLVIGRKGSGVTTLLTAFGGRADAQDALIVDEADGDGTVPTLPEGWDSDAAAAWLKGRRADRRSHVVLAGADLRSPRRLLQSLADDPDLARSHRLSTVTLAVDATAAGCRAGLSDPDSRAAATADRIVLTHTDRARPEAVTRLAKALKALNPPAPILRARNGDIGPARLVDSGLFDPIDGSVDIDRWLCEAAFGFEASRRGVDTPKPSKIQSTLGRSAGGVRFFAVTIDQPLDATMLAVFLKLLMADRGADLLRLKGIVATEDHPDRPALIDAREHLVQPLLWLPAWPTADRRSRLVFTAAGSAEDWIRTLLTTLCDRPEPQSLPELPMVMAEKAG